MFSHNYSQGKLHIWFRIIQTLLPTCPAHDNARGCETSSVNFLWPFFVLLRAHFKVLTLSLIGSRRTRTLMMIRTKNGSGRTNMQHLKFTVWRGSHLIKSRGANILCVTVGAGVKIYSSSECHPTWVVRAQVPWGCNVSHRSQWKAAARLLSDQRAVTGFVLVTVIKRADSSQVALSEIPAV